MKPFKADARAAPEVQDSFAALQGEVFEGCVPDTVQPAHGIVVGGGEALVAFFDVSGVGGGHGGDYRALPLKEENLRRMNGLCTFLPCHLYRLAYNGMVYVRVMDIDLT